MIKSRTARLNTGILLWGLILMTPSAALSGETEVYPVLSHAEYEAVTGCDVDISSYEKSLRVALTFLVFQSEPVRPDDDFEETSIDEHYVRRHSRQPLERMFASKAAGGSCLHSTIAKIGGAVGFPETDEGAQPLERIREPAEENPFQYLITSRSKYIQSTGCLVSRSTYDHFRVAFFEHVLNWSDGYNATVRLSTFLRETGEGKHTNEGFLDPTCMTPSIERIAIELAVLNEEGQFDLQ
jgi:hypothetical protein